MHGAAVGAVCPDAKRPAMQEVSMELLLVWILNTVALLIVAYLLPGMQVVSFGTALVAALVLGLLNTLVKPFLVLLSLPVGIVSLGLLLLVLNALGFWFVGSVLKGFQMQGLWSVAAGTVVYSLVSGLLSRLLP